MLRLILNTLIDNILLKLMLDLYFCSQIDPIELYLIFLYNYFQLYCILTKSNGIIEFLLKIPTNIFLFAFILKDPIRKLKF